MPAYSVGTSYLFCIIGYPKTSTTKDIKGGLTLLFCPRFLGYFAFTVFIFCFAESKRILYNLLKYQSYEKLFFCS